MSTMTMTDGGLETVLVFRDGFELPAFAAFPLLETDGGRAALTAYFRGFLAAAHERDLPFVLDTATWRANPDWGDALGYSDRRLRDANAYAVDFAHVLAAGRDDVIVNGVVGPRGDGYVVSDRMSADEAADYHALQIDALATAGADRISAVTLTYPDEAIGITRAADDRGVEVVLSFTVETDGRLPDGSTLDDAIARVDAATGHRPHFYMVNCAHPTHLDRSIRPEIAARVGGLRANGSPMSHAELDTAEELHADRPDDLAAAHATLRETFPAVELLGGCCGTGLEHVTAIVDRW